MCLSLDFSKKHKTDFSVLLVYDNNNRQDEYPELYAEAAERGVPPPKVDFVDVGCGFGGLTVLLAEAYPDKLVVGMEIREKLAGTYR